MTTTPAITAATLCFVHTCTDLSRAIAQHKAAERKVMVWEAGVASGNTMSEKMLAGALENAAAWFLRVAELFEAENPEAVELAPVEPIEAPRAPTVVDIAAEADIEAMRERGRQKRAAEKAKSQPVREPADVCRVRVMRRFYAACKSAGLNTANVDALKIALCKYLGLRPGFSRHDLSASHWAEAVAAVELGLLTWA